MSEMKIRLVDYEKATKNLDGLAIYICDEGNKHFSFRRHFDQKGNCTFECVQDRDSRYTKMYKDGKSVCTTIETGLGRDEDRFGTWRYNHGCLRGGYFTGSDKEKDLRFECFDDGNRIFIDNQKNYLFNSYTNQGPSFMPNLPNRPFLITESMVSREIESMDIDGIGQKKRELYSLSKRVNEELKKREKELLEEFSHGTLKGKVRESSPKKQTKKSKLTEMLKTATKGKCSLQKGKLPPVNGGE